ncbi:hypothetical protein Asppvi_001490 [Aspergillus pseudoviridinutans]|uniref:Uncharacterized protein n=1 Tax=Aspergillus pseudoviridinutans TaxID=1517512 RepID=A0A9P3ERG3_9EURO|nr:uncharacterized protein Asppvi_001490 [Aspergillus pseudoviridinutans]GIJ82973.1 hypothetical protein Asppvi_001490 [Aspergillus pseudoviridinutans]
MPLNPRSHIEGRPEADDSSEEASCEPVQYPPLWVMAERAILKVQGRSARFISRISASASASAGSPVPDQRVREPAISRISAGEAAERGNRTGMPDARDSEWTCCMGLPKANNGFRRGRRGRFISRISARSREVDRRF